VDKNKVSIFAPAFEKKRLFFGCFLDKKAREFFERFT